MNSGKADLPSIWGGGSTPAISRKVGAKSMFKTMSSMTEPGSIPGPLTKNGTLTSNSNGKLLPYGRKKTYVISKESWYSSVQSIKKGLAEVVFLTLHRRIPRLQVTRS